MMIYERWNPIEGLEGYFYLENLQDDLSHLDIILEQEKTKRLLGVRFFVALSYMNTQAGEFIRSAGYGSYKGVFLTIKNSPYLNWFLDESCRGPEERNVVHYSIRTQHHIIDVLSAHEVAVKWHN